MKEIPILSSPCRSLALTVVIMSLILLAGLIFFLPTQKIAFSQFGNDSSLLLDRNTTNSVLPTSNESAVTSDSPGFVATGKINTVIDVPNGKWLAAGNWSIIVNNGNVTSFETKMTWYNSTGTNAHAHDLLNFRSVSDDTEIVPINKTNKQITLEGYTDVASNGRISWFEVPTTITINDRKIISISVDDSMTNGHFGGQPLLGIIDIFTPCSDIPGPNMELLPPCSPVVQGEEVFGFVNDTTGFPPQGDFPGEDFSQQGIPEQAFPGEDFQGSSGDQFLPEDNQNGEQSLSKDDQIGEQTLSGDDEIATGKINPACAILNIENVTANGFESDPSDYHPPSDAIDGNSSSWWSNNGQDPWIEILLSESHTICGVSVEWNKGDQRDYSFEIQVSEDGNNYEKIFEGTSMHDSSEPKSYSFEEEHRGKYIKLTITSTSSEDGWVSIKEISALGLS